MTAIDLAPAAKRLADLIASIPDDALTRPTPCADTSLGDLIDHVGGLSLAFTAAARKDIGGAGSQQPSADASRLGNDWRTRIPRDLNALAEAWRDPDAWTGMTQAGGLDLPGEVAGVIALDEVVINGWDAARAAGVSYECDAPALEAVHGFVVQFAGPGQEAQREGLFGPVVPVPHDAPLLDRVIGLTGRDPNWSAPR